MTSIKTLTKGISLLKVKLQKWNTEEIKYVGWLLKYKHSRF